MTNEEAMSRKRRILSLQVEAAWLNRSGERDWQPGEILLVGEDITVSPVWRIPGKYGAWMHHLPKAHESVEAWAWEDTLGADNEDEDEGWFFIDGSHADIPPVPDDLVEWLVKADQAGER